jgi:hypothetical protein
MRVEQVRSALLGLGYAKLRTLKGYKCKVESGLF